MEEDIRFELHLSLEGKELTREQIKRLTQNIVNAVVLQAENFGLTPDDAEETSATFIKLRAIEEDVTVRVSIQTATEF